MSDVLVDSANSNNAGNLAQQYGPTYYNRPQRFIINYSWLIPTSQLKGVANAVLGGWTVSGVTTIQDGVPFTFLDTGAGSAYGTNGNQTTAGFARAQICPGMTYANIATPGGIEIAAGWVQWRPGLFQCQRFLSRSCDHAGRRDRNYAGRMPHLRYFVRKLRRRHSAWAGPVQLRCHVVQAVQFYGTLPSAVPRGVLQFAESPAVQRHLARIWNRWDHVFPSAAFGCRREYHHPNQREPSRDSVRLEVLVLSQPDFHRQGR
jgi:hypothetical protein